MLYIFIHCVNLGSGVLYIFVHCVNLGSGVLYIFVHCVNLGAGLLWLDLMVSCLLAYYHICVHYQRVLFRVDHPVPKASIK